MFTVHILHTESKIVIYHNSLFQVGLIKASVGVGKETYRELKPL